MSTDDDTFSALHAGILCYLHLWATLNKRVKIGHEEIAPDIGLWGDRSGGFFAAYTRGNRRMLQVNESYVCAAGEEGPTVGQLSKVPPCDPVVMPSDARMLLNALAQTGTDDAEQGLKQIDMIAVMIAANLPKRDAERRIVN